MATNILCVPKKTISLNVLSFIFNFHIWVNYHFNLFIFVFLLQSFINYSQPVRQREERKGKLCNTLSHPMLHWDPERLHDLVDWLAISAPLLPL